MLNAIQNNLSTMRDLFSDTLTNSLTSLFDSYFSNLKDSFNDEVYLSNVYQCTLLNDYVRTEISYLKKNFLEEVKKFMLDLPNSRNSGFILTYQNPDDFELMANSLKKSPKTSDIAILRKNEKLEQISFSDTQFDSFINSVSDLSKLTKLTLDFKFVSLRKNQLVDLVKAIKSTDQSGITSLAFDFSENPMNLDDDIGEYLLEIFDFQRYLHSFVLSFSNTSIGARTIEKLCDLLLFNGNNLHFLRLSLNNIPFFLLGKSYLEQLAKSLATNNRITHLELFFGRNMSFDDLCVDGFFYYLQFLRNLEHLELDFSESKISIHHLLGKLTKSDSFFGIKVLFLYLNDLEYFDLIVEDLENISNSFVFLEQLQIQMINESWSEEQRRKLQNDVKKCMSEKMFTMNLILEK